MATQTAYHPTPSQYASAACHLDRRADWRGVRIDGTRYVVLQSGNSGRTYICRADAGGCSCPWYLQTGRQCSHMLSLELAALADELQQTAAEAPAPVKPMLTAEQLWPTCRARGCQNDPEPGERDCYRHVLCDAF